MKEKLTIPWHRMIIIKRQITPQVIEHRKLKIETIRQLANKDQMT